MIPKKCPKCGKSYLKLKINFNLCGCPLSSEARAFLQAVLDSKREDSQ